MITGVVRDLHVHNSRNSLTLLCKRDLCEKNREPFSAITSQSLVNWL